MHGYNCDQNFKRKIKRPMQKRFPFFTTCAYSILQMLKLAIYIYRIYEYKDIEIQINCQDALRLQKD